VTERELVQLIAREVAAALQLSPPGPRTPPTSRNQESNTIPIGVSVRHVHLCQEDMEKLFGDGYELHIRNELYQPGTYAAQETLTLVTPKRVLQNVRILLPLRKETQVELAYSDAVYLGLNPPIVLSGHSLKGSPGVVMVGPKGAVDLQEGVIIAARHIHAHPTDAARWKVQNGDAVDVAIDGPRSMILKRVIMRVSENSRLEMHLDTDEANAACVSCGVTARFVGLTDGTRSV